MHYFERNIVEIKREYTIFMTSILAPLLYEGLVRLYSQAVELTKQMAEKEKDDPEMKNPGVLKYFQMLLKDIPNLNNFQIEQETNRIKDKCNCSEWFDDLVRATIKSNIILLTFNASGKQSKIISDKYHESIDVREFIHKCYIECARTFHNYPHIFWHEYDSFVLKQNQREIIMLITKAIEHAIRKMLPIKLILEEYLKNDYVPEQDTNQYTKIRNLVNSDMYHNIDTERGNNILISTESNNMHGGSDDANHDDLGELEQLLMGNDKPYDNNNNDNIDNMKQAIESSTSHKSSDKHGGKGSEYTENIPMIKKPTGDELAGVFEKFDMKPPEDKHDSATSSAKRVSHTSSISVKVNKGGLSGSSNGFD